MIKFIKSFIVEIKKDWAKYQPGGVKFHGIRLAKEAEVGIIVGFILGFIFGCLFMFLIFSLI